MPGTAILAVCALALHGAAVLQPVVNMHSAPTAESDVVSQAIYGFGSSDQKISHTGLYLGNGKFINATIYQTPTVRIDDLNDPHWSRRLVAIRRVK